MNSIFKQITDTFDQPAVLCELTEKKILTANHACLGLLGCRQRDIVGKYFEQVFSLQADSEGRLSWKKAGVKYKVKEVRLDVAGKTYYKAVFKELSQDKMVEQLTAARSMAELLMHRIRSPLTAMQGFAEMLSGVDLEKQAILDGILEISGILSDMDEFVEELKPVKEPVDIYSIVQKILSKLSAKSRNRIRIEKNKEFGNVFADPKLCEKVLKELISNAVEHSTGELDEVVLSFQSSGLLQITNLGDPIPKTLVSRIFMPFVTTKARSGGLGLTKTLIWLDAMSGSIILKTNSASDGIGFEIQFPSKKG